MLIKNPMLSGIEPRRSHVRRNGHTNRIAYALAERPGGAFHSRCVAKFRMSRRFRMKLPESFDFRHRQIVAAHMQPSKKEHAAMPRGEHEDIAIDPARLVWIVSERMPEKHGANFRAAQWKAKMT